MKRPRRQTRPLDEPTMSNFTRLSIPKYGEGTGCVDISRVSHRSLEKT